MRVAEGLAAGVLQPIPAIVILHAFGSGERGKAMGIFGFGVVLAPAVGPSVGGILVEWWGWRSIFFVVAPFCAVALVMARRYLPIGAPGGGAGQPRRRPARRRRPRPDRGGRARAAERHGPSPRGHARPRPGAARLQRDRRGRLRRPPAARRAAADGARPVRPSRLRDGRLRRLHLRHGLVRLDLPGAGVHAGGAAPAAFAGRRGAAAGGHRPRRDDPGRRADGRPHRR